MLENLLSAQSLKASKLICIIISNSVKYSMKISHLSVSRKQCWDLCEQQYKYRYHLNVVSNKPQQIYFTYGQIIHKGAELYVESKGSNTLEHYIKNIIEGNIAIQRDSDNKSKISLPIAYQRKIGDHVRAIKNITEYSGFDGDLEFEFKLDLDPPNNITAYGFIDRLIKKNDKIFIIDYKTTKKGPYRKNKFTIKSDLQMQTYALVVKELFNIKAENIVLALFYLDGCELISVSFSEETLQNCKKTLIETYKKIINKDPDEVHGNVGEHCRRCDYNDICPFFKKG